MKRKVISYLYAHVKESIPNHYLENKYLLSSPQFVTILQELIDDGFLITYSLDTCCLHSLVTTLCKEAICSYLDSDYSIEIFDSIDSTNSYAKRTPSPYKRLLITNHQTSGKGRGNHSFYSPKDSGIYMSLVYPKSFIYLEQYQYPILASCAIYKALQELFNIEVKLKWVNDIYYDNAKVGGILVEDDEEQLIIGIGLNILNDIKDLKENTRQDISSLQLYGCSRNEIIACIIKQFELLCKQSWQSILTLYKQQSCLLDRAIYFQVNQQTFYGKVVDIDHMGRLVVEVNNQKQILQSGEVHIGSIKK